MVLNAGKPHLEKTRGLSPSFLNFVYRGTHFCAMVAADRTTTETTRSGPTENEPRPLPLASDGSDIPILRDHISVASSGPCRGIIYACLLAPVVAPPCLSSACCLAARDLEKTAWIWWLLRKYTVASSHACAGCVLWRSETAFGGSPSLPSILLSETPLVIGGVVLIRTPRKHVTNASSICGWRAMRLTRLRKRMESTKT